MEIRDADDTDTERIRELARSTMTASYALSPQQLDAITRERFEADSLERAIEDPDTRLLVAEDDDSDASEEAVVAGFVEGRIADGDGELRWLFVDPEHRGMGAGTELFEAGTEALRENGAERVTASVLDANTEGGTFFERVGLERTDERQVEIGEESFVEYCYADPSSAASDDAAESESGGTTVDGEEADESKTEDVLDADLPGTATREGTTLATSDDREVYLDREAVESGTEGSFVVAYTDEDLTDQYGYYCANCGSLDTAVDESDRIECTDCGNTHAQRSAEAYDDSYL